MNRQNVNMVLSIVLGGMILFGGYKMYEKYETRKAVEAVNGIMEKVYNNENKDEGGLPPKIVDSKDYEKEKEEREKALKEQEKTNEEQKTNSKEIKETNSIYKSDVSEKQVEILEEKYNEKTAEFHQLYGSAFRQYGGPIYGEGKEALNSAKEFYGRTDKILNDLWGDLNKILRPDIYKTLQKEQVEWIKERDVKASESGNPGTTAYIDEQGRETYKRVGYLIDTYLE